MSKEKRALLIFIITITLFVITFIVFWRIYMVPIIEEVMIEAVNAPNPRVQEALSEPVVSAGLYALDGQTGQVQWATQLEGISFSDPAVAGDRVFLVIHISNSAGLADTISSRAKTVAIEAETGREVWRKENYYSYARWVVVKYPPIATPDIMINYTGSPMFNVYEADTGGLLHLIDGVVTSSRNPDDVLPVALTEDRLIVRHEPTDLREIADAVQVYDLHSGDLLWSTSHEPYPEERNDDAVHLSPILADNQRVFLEVVDQFQVFDIDSGDFLFALDQTCKRAAIQGSTLYCVYGDLKAFDAATGELLWSFEPDIDLQEVEAVEDNIYVTTAPTGNRPYEQWLIALNSANGSERWRVKLWDGTGNNESLWYVPPSVGEEMVFAIQITKRKKALVALSSTDGTQLWQFPLYSDDRHIPVSDGEQVYIVDIAAQ